ncbi:MAG: VTT domain-containing protein [Chloroflexi bacterium]|nr:VTT domain-containing protein [Chloroflexota bacterium]
MLNPSKQAEPGKKVGLRDKVIPLLTILLVVAISVFFFAYHAQVARFEKLGYLGAFLISLVANATVLLPMPGLLLISTLGTVFNPVLVALAAAAGGTIGEISGYLTGYSGHGVIQRTRLYVRGEGWMKKWGLMTIFIFAVAPFLPLDVAGMLAGALRFPLWKFLLVVWVGKSLKYIGLLSAGAWGWEAFNLGLNLMSPTSASLLAALAALTLLVIALAIEDWTWHRPR